VPVGDDDRLLLRPGRGRLGRVGAEQELLPPKLAGWWDGPNRVRHPGQVRQRAGVVRSLVARHSRGSAHGRVLLACGGTPASPQGPSGLGLTPRPLAGPFPPTGRPPSWAPAPPARCRARRALSLPPPLLLLLEFVDREPAASDGLRVQVGLLEAGHRARSERQQEARRSSTSISCARASPSRLSSTQETAHRRSWPRAHHANPRDHCAGREAAVLSSSRSSSPGASPCREVGCQLHPFTRPSAPAREAPGPSSRPATPARYAADGVVAGGPEGARDSR
jgi:hypothetical protein